MITRWSRPAGCLVTYAWDGEQLEQDRVELATRLIVRESTAPPIRP
jgi:hypothetical protein